MADLVSKSSVLDIYAELYDVFDDNKEIQKELNKVYDKLRKLKEQEDLVCCKDCKHSFNYSAMYGVRPYRCGKHQGFRDADWFCADGERR